MKTHHSSDFACRVQPIFGICEPGHHRKDGFSTQLVHPFLELSYFQAPEMNKAQSDAHHRMHNLTIPSRCVISVLTSLMSITACI